MNIKQIFKFIAPIICCIAANSICDKRFRFGFTYDGERSNENESSVKFNNEKSYTYSDAIKAVSNSYMDSNSKEVAISCIKQGKSSEVYKAIIEVTKSTMSNSSKTKSIESIMGGVTFEY